MSFCSDEELNVSKNDNVFEDAVAYAREKIYKNDQTANQKRVIRKKASKLAIIDGEVFIKKKGEKVS